MAQLPPDGEFLMQQHDQEVVLFRQGSEEELVRFNPSDADATARAQATIYGLPQLNPEQKCFAHFWSGYFHAFAAHGMVLPHSFLPGRRTKPPEDIEQPE